MWGRRADQAASLGDVPFALVPELSDTELLAGRGLVMLPTWLAAATAPVELEPSADGLPQYQATVPADVVGEVERGIEAEDLLAVVVLDDDGTPVRVELTSATSDRLHLVLDLTGVGEPVDDHASGCAAHLTRSLSPRSRTSRRGPPRRGGRRTRRRPGRSWRA